MKIRRFVPEDSEAVQLLHESAMDQVGANMGPGPWNDDLRNIERIYLKDRSDFLVGELEGEIVAMGALREIESLVAEIKRMRVAPNAQRQGYGQRIYDELEKLAIAHGYSQLVLDTLTQQTAAIKFYTKNGFFEYEREIFRGEVQLLLRKQLEPGT